MGHRVRLQHLGELRSDPSPDEALGAGGGGGLLPGVRPLHGDLQGVPFIIAH